MILKIILFLLIALLQINLDKTICKDKLGTILLYVHHLLSIYLIFGSLFFGYYKIHLMIVIISLLVHYKFFECPITIVNNIICKQPTTKPLNTYLDHILDLLNLNNNENTTKQIYYLLLLWLIIFDLYKITN